MTDLRFDTIVIGGGPAGMAAALEAARQGAKTALLERAEELGGILEQCIHCGFGLSYFKEELTGPEYAQRFVDEISKSNIKVFVGMMATDVAPGWEVTAVSRKGIQRFSAPSVVLCTGCRERPRGAIRIPGARVAGVFTAGQAQQYINRDGLQPGKRFVSLGSGDIGLIMARRLTLEGMHVCGVYEIMPYANGLRRNIINCLEDFQIPLSLSTTVTRVIGKDRVEAVEISTVDEKQVPIIGTEEVVPCDGLLLAVGLIPENELALTAGISLDPVTGGPVVDDRYMTNCAGIFACGNALQVHDLVDNVTMEAQSAGRYAACYALGKMPDAICNIPIQTGEYVRYVVPSVLRGSAPVKISFRVGRPMNGRVELWQDGRMLWRGKQKKYEPSIMEQVSIPVAGNCDSPITLRMKCDEREGAGCNV